MADTILEFLGPRPCASIALPELGRSGRCYPAVPAKGQGEMAGRTLIRPMWTRGLSPVLRSPFILSQHQLGQNTSGPGLLRRRVMASERRLVWLMQQGCPWTLRLEAEWGPISHSNEGRPGPGHTGASGRAGGSPDLQWSNTVTHSPKGYPFLLHKGFGWPDREGRPREEGEGRNLLEESSVPDQPPLCV